MSCNSTGRLSLGIRSGRYLRLRCLGNKVGCEKGTLGLEGALAAAGARHQRRLTAQDPDFLTSCLRSGWQLRGEEAPSVVIKSEVPKRTNLAVRR